VSSAAGVKRFMLIFDAHAGWDRRLERGKWVTKPTFSMEGYRVMTRFAQDFAPDIVLYGGDQLNAGPISHWHKGKPILDEGFRLKDEMEFLDEHLLYPIESGMTKGSRKIWMTGNHEQWIMDHVAANPGLQGIVEPESYLDLEQRKYEIYSQGEIASIGKLHNIHGDTFFKKANGGQNPARALVNAFRRNIRCGHLHTGGWAAATTAIDAADYHTAIIYPGMSTRGPAYNQGMPNNTLIGFGYGYSWSNGDFADYVVIVTEGRAFINGRPYDGSKK
jgi:hypothetical protein